MTKDQFWQTIDELNKTSFHKDQESRQVLMSESLHHHSLEDIMDWHLIMTAYHELANRDDLWAACTRLGAWDTDDGFSDFRSWLISRGKEVYMNALRDPHSLDTVPYEGEKLNFELFAYSAYHAYDAKMFRIIPRSMDTLFNALKTHELDPQTLQDIRAEIPRQKHHSRDRLGHMFRVAFGVGSDVNANLKMSIFAETKCNFSPVSTEVYTALIHQFTCRFEARQALIYQLVLGLTGENGKYNYSRAVHVYPLFFDITCSAKNYKIAPALTRLSAQSTSCSHQ